MSEKKGGDVAKRFFVKGTVDLFERMQHLAIDMKERGVEQLGGKLLAEIVAQKEREFGRAAPHDAPKRPKR